MSSVEANAEIPLSETLLRYFGYATFRGGQEPIIEALLADRNALAIFPTGGGKSLCYQLPALRLDGVTLVISPLIALMKDQTDALRARGVSAARMDSSLNADEVAQVWEELENGRLKLLYIAPERLANEAFRQRLKNVSIALVAIDEAHCISQWGHNFRPDYLKVAKICRALKIPRVLALTATATPRVARDIRREFRIAAADQVQLSFHRSNLDLRVTPVDSEHRKEVLFERLAEVEGSAIVYVTRQETAEAVATGLVKAGFSARAYHAGLADAVRSEAQADFMAGKCRIMVATIAFGMGIDKANIRAVFHYNLPKSLENYTQEIGRAGRDGLPARCELLACGGDLTVLENFIHADTPGTRALGNLVSRLLRLGERFDVSHYELSVTCDIRQTVVTTVITYLEIAGILEATGIFYGNYRVRLLRPLERVVAGMRPTDRRFLERLFAAGKTGRSWVTFDPQALSDPLQVKRETIVAVIGNLEAAGDAAVAISGVRHGYRLKKVPESIPALTESLVKQFAERELADLDRLNQVLSLSSTRGCLTDHLIKHFGERLAGPCGHCDRCRGVPALRVKRPTSREVTREEVAAIQQLVGEGHAALSSPRQVTRFLCGLSSPAAYRARLTRHDAFGLLAELPFAEVQAWASAAFGEPR